MSPKEHVKQTIENVKLINKEIDESREYFEISKVMLAYLKDKIETALALNEVRLRVSLEQTR